MDACGVDARTGVNPSLTALLKHTARCPLLNSVFLWADFYLHLKGMLIVQMCKQPPNSSIKGTCLLWGFCSRNQAEMRKSFLNSRVGPFEYYWSEKSAEPWSSPTRQWLLKGIQKKKLCFELEVQSSVASSCFHGHMTLMDTCQVWPWWTCARCAFEQYFYVKSYTQERKFPNKGRNYVNRGDSYNSLYFLRRVSKMWCLPGIRGFGNLVP